MSNKFLFLENYFVKKLIPNIKKSIFKKFLRVFIIQFMFFVLCIITMLFFYNITQIRQKNAEAIEHIQLAPFILTQNIKEISDDLQLLSDDVVLQKYKVSSEPEILKRLEERFLFLGNIRNIYTQIRYLDSNGFEIIRIQRDLNGVKVVDKSDLQDKSDRYYFEQTNELNKGEIYISAIDLNIDYGAISQPPQPTIRFGIPVFSIKGERMGSIILNYDGRFILSEFREHFITTKDTAYGIIRFDGKYIISFDGAKDWDDKYSFQLDEPYLWSLMNDKNLLQLKTDKGVFTILTVYPVKEAAEHLSNGSKDVNILGPDGSVEMRRFLIVAWDTPDSILSVFKYINLKIIFILFLVQIIIAIFIWNRTKDNLFKKVFGVWMESFFQGIEKNPASVVMTDRDGNIQYVNNKFIELSGYNYSEVYMENPKILKSGEMSDSQYKELWDNISSGKTWSGELHNKKKGGALYWVNASISPIYNDKGQIIRFLGVQEDISIRKKLTEELTQLATTDPLTGLLNRRSFYERVEAEIIRCNRNDNRFSLFMIDIDFFKKVNDIFGHKAGDEVLVDLSRIIEKTFRASDICARYGGEEFIVCLPETDLNPGFLLADAFRKTIEERIVTSQNRSIRYTLSIGLVQWNKGEDLDTTISRADKLLYKAKEKGRNIVITE